MKSKAIICTLIAASFSVASLSFAQGYERPDGGPPRGEQRGPMGRDGHDSGRHRGFDQRDQRDNRHGPDAGPRGFGPRDEVRNDWQYGARGPQFHRGGRIPPEYRNRQYVVNNWREHRLSAPPRGQQWVQVGADYVLVAIATGVIVQLLLNQ